MSHYNGTDSMFSEIGTAEKLFKARSLYDAFCLSSKRCKMLPRFIIIEYTVNNEIQESGSIVYFLKYSYTI